MKFRIRSVIKQDHEKWLGLWEGYNIFYGRVGDKALASEITQSTWERFFDESEPIHALVAESDEYLYGIAHFLFHRNTMMIEPICYLQDLFVDETFRGHGVGRALIETVYDEAREAGATRVYWNTHETNIHARSLYDTIAQYHGFIRYQQDIN